MASPRSKRTPLPRLRRHHTAGAARLSTAGTHATRWPYVALGIGFALYGIAMFLLGTRRMGAFDRTVWLTRGGSSEDRMLVAFMGAGTILGIGTLAVIVVQ